MKPISWREGLKNYGGEDNGQPQFHPLPVLEAEDANGTPVKISAWRPDFMDLVRIVFGAPIFLMINGPQPPVLLTTHDPEKQFPRE